MQKRGLVFVLILVLLFLVSCVRYDCDTVGRLCTTSDGYLGKCVKIWNGAKCEVLSEKKPVERQTEKFVIPETPKLVPKSEKPKDQETKEPVSIVKDNYAYFCKEEVDPQTYETNVNIYKKETNEIILQMPRNFDCITFRTPKGLVAGLIRVAGCPSQEQLNSVFNENDMISVLKSFKSLGLFYGKQCPYGCDNILKACKVKPSSLRSS